MDIGIPGKKREGSFAVRKSSCYSMISAVVFWGGIDPDRSSNWQPTSTARKSAAR